MIHREVPCDPVEPGRERPTATPPGLAKDANEHLLRQVVHRRLDAGDLPQIATHPGPVAGDQEIERVMTPAGDQIEDLVVRRAGARGSRHGFSL